MDAQGQREELPMQKIMLATDFSERSDRALRRAVLIARESGAHLDLVHVVDDDRPRRIVDHESADARRLLNDLARLLRTADGVSCGTQIVLADPFVGIARAVEDAPPDLLVIGPHRRQILRDAFVGTTAERTIRAVACPVLMVNGPPVGSYRHMLLTTDLSDGSREALQRFGNLELGTQADLSVLSVYDAPALRLAMSAMAAKGTRHDYLSEQGAEARRALSTFMVGVGGRRAEQIVRLAEMSVDKEILKAANELAADLIVVSTKDNGTIARMLLGSVTEQVLRSSPVDVLVISPRDAV